MLKRAMSPPDWGGYLNMSEIIKISNLLADLYEIRHASLKQVEHNIMERFQNVTGSFLGFFCNQFFQCPLIGAKFTDRIKFTQVLGSNSGIIHGLNHI